MKIASNAAIFSCCTGKCLAKCVQLNIYCSSMLKSSFVGAALLLQFDIEAFCFGYHLLVRLLFFFNFLFARLSHKRFLSFHILREGRRSTRSSGRTHAHNVSLIGRQVQAGSLLCPFHTGHAIHAIRPFWEDRPERSVNRAATMTRREQWPTTWPSRLHFFRPSAISSL